MIANVNSTVTKSNYHTRTNKSGSRFDYTLTYDDNSVSNINGFVGVVYQMNRASYWFRYPSEISQRNSVNVSSYARQVMDAPVTIEEANEDDSYSLQDIVEFHPEIATAIMPMTGARFDDYNENELILDNATFQIIPQPGWSMQFQNLDGNTITVNSGENFTTTSTIRLTALQQIVNAVPVTYSGDMSYPDAQADPFTYEGEYQYPEAEVVSEVEIEDVTNGATWTISLLRAEDNIETDTNEFGYYVRTVIDSSTKYTSPTRSRLFDSQEQAEIEFDKVVASAEATIENDRLAAEAAAEAEAEAAADAAAAAAAAAKAEAEARDLSGFIPVLLFSILAITLTAGVVRAVGGVE